MGENVAIIGGTSFLLHILHVQIKQIFIDILGVKLQKTL